MHVLGCAVADRVQILGGESEYMEVLQREEALDPDVLHQVVPVVLQLSHPSEGTGSALPQAWQTRQSL